jgi:hypothetical protein
MRMMMSVGTGVRMAMAAALSGSERQPLRQMNMLTSGRVFVPWQFILPMRVMPATTQHQMQGEGEDRDKGGANAHRKSFGWAATLQTIVDPGSRRVNVNYSHGIARKQSGLDHSSPPHAAKSL